MKTHFRESQRDFIRQPRVGRAAGYPGSLGKCTINAERVAAPVARYAATPLGLEMIWGSTPREVAALHAWADGRCPIGAMGWPPLAEPGAFPAEQHAMKGPDADTTV